MAQSIWKYTLVAETTQTIEMPKGAKILSAEEQREEIVVYALVNPDEEDKERVTLAVYGTGHVVPDYIYYEFAFLQTVKMQGGSLMFHVFYFWRDRS